jgi:hypothetical protein
MARDAASESVHDFLLVPLVGFRESVFTEALNLDDQPG